MKKYFLIILLFFILDRFTKVYILNLPAGRQESHPWGGFFSLQINSQAAFSLPMTYFLLYPIIVLLIIILLWFWQRDWQRQSILIWPWALIIIGAISNLMDRIQYGGVIDFISVPYFIPRFFLGSATVFNLSDVYISIGVIWILWYQWFFRKNSFSRSTS